MKLNDNSNYEVTLSQRENVIPVKGTDFSKDRSKGKERYRTASSGPLALFVCIRRDDNVSVNDSFARETVGDDLFSAMWTRFASMREV